MISWTSREAPIGVKGKALENRVTSGGRWGDFDPRVESGDATFVALGDVYGVVLLPASSSLSKSIYQRMCLYRGMSSRVILTSVPPAAPKKREFPLSLIDKVPKASMTSDVS